MQNMDLKEWPLWMVEEALLNHMKDGRSLDEFLADYNLRKRKWERYVEKNRKIQYALVDGVVFFKAYWKKKLETRMFQSPSGTNTTLFKMHLEQALGWSELAVKLLKDEKPRKMYKVILDLRPEPENEDVITPEKPKNKLKGLDVNKKLGESEKSDLIKDRIKKEVIE